MSDLFLRWISADNKIYALKKQIEEIESELKKYQQESDDARIALHNEMAENGLIEDIINGEFIDYKIYPMRCRMSFVKLSASLNCEKLKSI